VVATDGGTFEINPNDFGSQATKGGINKWQRGVPGNFLVTVNSPVNVWKTDLTADLTEGDYVSVLQTPSFNFTSSASAYTLRFRRSMEIAFCNGPFAVQLQYSTDKGQTWTRLGVNADPAATNWYNRTITSNNTLATYNITTGVPALVGQPDVTFRFVLSVQPGYSATGYAVDGFMVDDFEILGPANPAIGAAPTAANASVGGRVLTAGGNGVRNAGVMITDGGLTAPRYAQTTTFGNYQFADLPVGQTYVVQVLSKKYTFQTPSIVLNVQDNVADADFVADEN
jgi:hypothetical protein